MFQVNQSIAEVWRQGRCKQLFLYSQYYWCNYYCYYYRLTMRPSL